MKRFKYLSFCLFFLICFVLSNDNVFAIPATGGFSCTYDIAYQNVTLDDEHNDLIISYGTYEGSNGKEGFSKKIVDSSKTVSSNFSLSYFVNHPDSTGFFDFTRVDVAKFYDSSNDKWVCPKIRYVVFKTGNTTAPYRFVLYAGESADDIKDYNSDVDAAGANDGSYGEIEATSKKISDPTKVETRPNPSGSNLNNGNNANIISCNPVKTTAGIEIVMEINRDTNVAYFSIDSQKANEIPNFTGGCKDVMDNWLTYCQHKYSASGDHSKDIVAFGESCGEYLTGLGLNPDDYNSYSTKETETTTTDANGETVDKTGVGGGVQLEKIDWDELGSNISLDCNDEDVKALMDDFNRYYRLIEVIIPILIILFGSIDLTKAVLNQDKDAMQKSIQAFVKRCIAGLAIYFLPLIIEVLLSLPGLPDAESVLCGIAFILR